MSSITPPPSIISGGGGGGELVGTEAQGFAVVPNQVGFPGQPPQEVVDAIEAGSATPTRRIEFFEADGETQWYPSGAKSTSPGFLVSGSVSVDYSRDERRSLDIVLNNSENYLRPNPGGGFWYDKRIRAFRGIKYKGTYTQPRIAIVDEETLNLSYELKAILQQVGYSQVDIRVDAVTADDLKDYDYIASYRKTTATTKAALLKDAYGAGKKILTFGAGNGPGEIPFIVTVTGTASREYGIDPVSYDSFLGYGWTAETYGNIAGGRSVTAIGASATTVAQHFDGSVTDYIAVIAANGNGGRWFNFESPQIGTQAKILIQNALGWLRAYEKNKSWETQIGEFGIDNISSDNTQKTTSVTGRDQTAFGLRSSFSENESFAAGTNLKQFVTAIAANFGVTKFKIASTGYNLPNRLDVSKGDSRWSTIKTVTDIAGFEIFFDQYGWLVMREYIDPTTGPISWRYETGSDGNLASYSRSINDSRIFNHIVVTGTPQTGLPFFGEAINTEPSSPTNVKRLGDRYFGFDSGIFGSDQECVNYAKRLLKTAALESFEISYGSFVYPWMEVGEIVKFLDPDRLEIEPIRFLQDSLTIPLDLAPMSGTGKRVTIVGDSG